MLNKISCLYFDWSAFSAIATAIGAIATAIGAIATAAAACVALIVWKREIGVHSEAARRRVNVSNLLMEEELARLSSHSVHVWKIAQDQSNSAANLARFLFEMKQGLSPHRAEALTHIAENVSFDLGGAAAKIVSKANMVLITYVLIQRAEVHQDAKVMNDRLVPLATMSLALIDACCEMARVLESEQGLPAGSIEGRVRTLENSIEGGQAKV